MELELGYWTVIISISCTYALYYHLADYLDFCCRVHTSMD